MLVLPVRAISPTARVARSKSTGEPEPTEDVEAPGPIARKARPSTREGKSFFQSPGERSSPAVQAALLELPKGG